MRLRWQHIIYTIEAATYHRREMLNGGAHGNAQGGEDREAERQWLVIAKYSWCMLLNTVPDVESPLRPLILCSALK